MKITKFRIGVTVPGLVDYSNNRMEIELEIEDSEDVIEATAKAKVLLADLIAGGNRSQFVKALKCMNFPHQEEVLADKLLELKNVEEEIENTKEALEKARTEANELLWSLEELKVLDRIRDAYNPTGSFWHGFAAVIKQVYPRTEDIDKTASNSTEQTTDTIEGPPF